MADGAICGQTLAGSRATRNYRESVILYMT